MGDTIDDIQEVLSTNGFGTAECHKHSCFLYVSIDEIIALARMPQVTRIHAPLPLPHAAEQERDRKLQVQLPISVGRVTSEGVLAHKVDKARAKYIVNGTGILIGVVGRSFNCRNGAANDTLSGDLPLNVTILNDSNSSCNADGFDDGRALIQAVFDVAPGARFAFHGVANNFTSGVVEDRTVKATLALADFGCDIIIETDFISAVDEPFFLDGRATQAIDSVVARGVSYYIKAPSFRPGSAWDAPSGFVPSGISPPNSTGQFHLFGNTSNGSPIISQRVGLRNTGSNFDLFIFQWDQPSFRVSGSPGCQSDLDIS